MDLVIVRENTEGFLADRNMIAGSGEFMPTADVALAVRKITAHGSRRIARQAFELARRRRGRVTAVHKVNVLKLTDGLFLRAVEEVGREFPDVVHDEVIIDAASALLVRDPAIVATNLFGDILSDLASELSGSLGLAPGLNTGDHHAAAQAQHGSAPRHRRPGPSQPHVSDPVGGSPAALAG